MHNKLSKCNDACDNVRYQNAERKEGETISQCTSGKIIILGKGNVLCMYIDYVLRILTKGLVCFCRALTLRLVGCLGFHSTSHKAHHKVQSFFNIHNED